jgi:site-specific DNA recombinase
MNKKYLFIYSRISTLEQKFNSSIKNQIKNIRRYFFDYKNIEIFSDIESGSSDNRIKYQLMINKIKEYSENGFEIVIGVYKLDRLHRSLLNLMKFIEFIKIYNVGLISITENFNLSTPQGKLFVQMLGSFAEFERELIKERMINGKIYKMGINGFIGGRLPFGYKYNKKNKKIILEKDKIKIIKDIFKMKKKNISGYSISLIINKKYPNFNFYPMKIYRILNNTIYYGIIKQKLLNTSKILKIDSAINKYYYKFSRRE